jgi:hypothetical protein
VNEDQRLPAAVDFIIEMQAIDVSIGGFDRLGVFLGLRGLSENRRSQGECRRRNQREKGRLFIVRSPVNWIVGQRGRRCRRHQSTSKTYPCCWLVNNSRLGDRRVRNPGAYPALASSRASNIGSIQAPRFRMVM